MFANLCKVFLLLYVVVTLQNITMAVSMQVQGAQMADKQKAEMKALVDGYEAQLQAYRAERDEFLKKGPPDDAAVYKQAMRKLASLEDEKKQDLDEKVQAAKESQQKLDEVTSYKALVQSIVDSRYIALSRIQEAEKEKQKAEREKAASERAFAEFKKSYEDELERQVDIEKKKLETEYKKKEASKDSEIEKEKRKLALEKRKLNQEQVEAISAKLKELARERRALKKEFAEKAEEKAQELAEEFDDYKEEARAKYNERLTKVKGEYEGKLAGVKASLSKTQGELESTEAENEGLQSENEGLHTANEGLRGDVESLRALKTGRGKLIGEIASGVSSAFGAGGVNAEANLESGEVAILFRDTYFDYGSAVLKPEMKAVLSKALPIYAHTVFGNKKYANKIGWVELVGFASPTYRGKFVDRSNMSAEARRALNYNMDLSYRRAKSIFEFIFDPGQMKFPFQKSMVLMTKVAGRSYLASNAGKGKGRAPASVTGESYCKEFNCSAEQRVAIRFHLAEAVPKGDK
jgi:outer membrane protein OmpA-like peptidoglycan-associated protein